MFVKGFSSLAIQGSIISSSCCLDSWTDKSISSAIEGTRISASKSSDSLILAASHSLSKRLLASWWTFESNRSMLCYSLNCSMQYLTIISSISRPPKSISPSVAWTSMLPSETWITEISKVLLPRSNTRTFFYTSSLWRLAAITTAVGSLMRRSTFSPAHLAAYSVASFWLKLK